MKRLTFQLEGTSPGTAARAGRLTTRRSEVLTPTFMPVGTQATVKGMLIEDLKQIGAGILLANTYHLLLRPGPEVFKHFGGIHNFMKWPGSVLTDSGGFQIFSLPGSRKIREDGAVFKSYVDGKDVLLSPEVSIATQEAIGSDIMMVLDECVPSTSDHAEAKRAMELTHRWAKRSLEARTETGGAMFAIVQGACHIDLRRDSAACLTDMPFDGYAIGGLAVGETKSEREDFTELAAALLPADKPRYLMGVGTPIDLLEAVHRGVDMFDCILPMSHAQQGTAYSSKGVTKLRRGVYKLGNGPIADDCQCYTCSNYSRGYIHHLIKAGEGLGWRLIGYHNLYFYQQLMRGMRQHILAGTFEQHYKERRALIAQSDVEFPTVPQLPSKTKQVPLTLGNYSVEIRMTDDGAEVGLIKQEGSGEVMHPSTAPDHEADALYVRQSGLMDLLKGEGEAAVIVWDVGLGAAHNAMAAVRAAEMLAAAGQLRRPMHIVSFENDLDSLRLALKHPRLFAHLRHAAPHAIARGERYLSACSLISWELREGDAASLWLDAPAADVVFFDPFSAKTDAPLWTHESFKSLRQVLSGRPAGLATYSTSTAVRAAMLAAGFTVMRGAGVGGRIEATLALSVFDPQHPACAAAVLDQEWLGRWRRSSAAWPADIEPEDPAFRAAIEQHPQFAN